jgi:glycerol-3-phosphate acyltransferase PlsX
MGKPQRKLRIAVDAMGGDFAPDEVVKGAVQGAREMKVEIILAGPEEKVEESLAKAGAGDASVRIVDAPQVIEEGEEPAFAVVRKPKCGVVVAARLMKDGEADAMISAGPTGAAMVAGLMNLGSLGGMERPVVGGPFVGLAPKTVVMDLGANIGCQPHHLVEFAVAGSVYAKTFLDVADPTVGLLNVGSEEGKGNEQAKEAYGLLKQSGLNFIGNVEGMDIVRGRANVIVCV